MSDFPFLPVEDFEVASWSPGAEGEGVPCTQVHLIYRVPELHLTMVMRLKSREVCNSLIDALIEHRDYVFGRDEK
jgi:hypothetical protein